MRRAKLARLSEAQNHRCCYCGTRTWLRTHSADNTYKYAGRAPGMRKWQMATLEHVRAQLHGGGESLWNLVMCCAGCNSARGSLYEAEQFYSFFEGRTGVQGRQYAIAQGGLLRERKADKDRSDQHARFVWGLALLFHQVPGLYEQMVQGIQQEKDEYHARRDAMNAAQRARAA